MTTTLKRGLIVAAAASLVMPLALMRVARGSDHADTPDNAAKPGQDISDVYIFPSPSDASKVVLVMNVSPLITPAQVATRRFDPNVLYQFKIDNTGDNVEDLVIQARFKGTSGSQTCLISGPTAPSETGTKSTWLTPNTTVGNFDSTFTLTNGAKVFCGTREDPFFFDLEQFFAILPDRAAPVTGVEPADPNAPAITTFRSPGIDFLSNGNYNVLSIVVELPKSMLKGTNGDKIGVWCTTSKTSSGVF
jgi:hypothetical protein